jgi:Tol biopolymer transport system component
LTPTQFAIANDWSPDGRFLLLHGVIDERMQSEVSALPLDGEDRKPFPVTEGPRDEGNAQFSHDGRWMAYQSDEAGHFDVYMQPFTGRSGTGGKRQVSLPGGVHLGGTQPRWRRDGRELFYVSYDGWLMAVPIDVGTDGQTVDIGAPEPLFMTRLGPAVQARSQYAVSPDGQQFLMNTIASQITPPITVILNWNAKP